MALLAAACLIPSVAGAEVVSRASVASDGTQANGPSFFALLSADGRFVAFESAATNLVPADTNGVIDVFVHDRVTRSTTRVSVDSDGTQGNGDSFVLALSADGSTVAFSGTIKLTACGGLLVRDRRSDTTACLIEPPPNLSRAVASNVALSGDGRVVTIASHATNLANPCTNGLRHVFVHDRVTRATTCVSVAPDGSPGNGDSGNDSDRPALALTSDGRVAAFMSRATNLASPCITGVAQIFVRDLATGVTSCVSVASGGTAGNRASSSPAVSSDGRFVAFDSRATNLAPPCTNSFDDPDIAGHIFVHDRVTRTTTCFSVAPNGSPGDHASGRPGISADGRFVAFESHARNLARPCTSVMMRPRGREGVLQVHVHDRLTRRTTCVSTNSAGTPGNASSGSPTVSANGDGRLVAFMSEATNLVPGDTNGLRDAFVARLPVGTNWMLTGPGSGLAPQVRGFDARGQATRLNRFAFDPRFVGGVRVAAGDVNGDGAADLISGAGPGGPPQVRVFSGSTAGVTLASFLAYPATFRGGVSVAGCRNRGDGGKDDLATGPGPGPALPVRVFQRTAAGTVVSQTSFFPYGTAFRGGTNVGCGNTGGDGRDDLFAGPGPGQALPVRVFRRTPSGGVTLIASFFPYGATYRGGTHVGGCDLDGDGKDDLVTGPGRGQALPVRVFRRRTDGRIVPLASVFPYGPSYRGGVHVGCGDFDGDGKGDLMTAPAPGNALPVRVFKRRSDGSLVPLANVFPYGPTFAGGVFPAGLR